MAYKIFLDANVILEYILVRSSSESVNRLFRDIEVLKYKAVISTSVFQICSYWILKEHSYEITKRLLLNLLNDVAIVDCKHDVVINALNSSITDIEDALQYYTALSHNLDYFISLDKELIKLALPSLPIFSPDNFLKR